MTRSLAPALSVPPPRRVPAWAWASFLVAACIAAPLLAVALTAAARPGASFLHIATTTLPEMLGNSALLVLLVALMAGSAGAISAWIVSTCEFRFRRVLEVALLLPLAMPAYLNGYVYTWLFDVAGPVQQGFRDLTGLRYGEYWAPEIRSLPGAALMLAMVLYPYVYLLCRAAFLQQSVCLVEASRTLGHGLPRTFVHVALPLARPALAAGIALALMETLADFGTVQHFGVRTFTTGIYEAWFGMDDRGAASAALGRAARLRVPAAGAGAHLARRPALPPDHHAASAAARPSAARLAGGGGDPRLRRRCCSASACRPARSPGWR
jgi:iron(III) transport system permease protein